MYAALGWIGGLLFSFCCVPQVVLSYRQGNSNGLSWGFLLMWTFGELFTIMYVWPKADYPLLFNYFFNLICLSVILRYKLFPKELSTEFMCSIVDELLDKKEITPRSWLDFKDVIRIELESVARCVFIDGTKDYYGVITNVWKVKEKYNLTSGSNYEKRVATRIKWLTEIIDGKIVYDL